MRYALLIFLIAGGVIVTPPPHRPELSVLAPESLLQRICADVIVERDWCRGQWQRCEFDLAVCYSDLACCEKICPGCK